jgi:hypothetical protein
MKIANKFDASSLDEQVNWLNEFLARFLMANPAVQQALDSYYSHCQVNDYDDEIKKFNLEKWCGGEVNPTLEIVQVKGQLKFATTHYGVLGPLSRDECNKQRVKEVIFTFFTNPLNFFKEL